MNKPKFALLSAITLLLVTGCGAPEASPTPTDQSTDSVMSEDGEVSAATFKSHLASDRMVMAKFGAPWCGPCKQVDVELDKLEAANRDQLTICRINVDNDPELAEEYSVYGLPSIFLFKDGKKVADWEGFYEADEFQQSIDEVK